MKRYYIPHGSKYFVCIADSEADALNQFYYIYPNDTPGTPECR